MSISALLFISLGITLSASMKFESQVAPLVHQMGGEVTDLAARELVVLLHGVRSPPPLLVPGLCPPLCPLLSLWEGSGEVKASGVWLSGSVLTNPARRRRRMIEKDTREGRDSVRAKGFMQGKMMQVHEKDKSHEMNAQLQYSGTDYCR